MVITQSHCTIETSKIYLNILDGLSNGFARGLTTVKFKELFGTNPRGNKPLHAYGIRFMVWQERQDPNPRPSVLENDAPSS